MNEGWYRVVWESFPDPLVIADRKGNVLKWNRSAGEWFGLPAHNEENPHRPEGALAELFTPGPEVCSWQGYHLVVMGKDLQVEYRILPLDAGEGSGELLLHIRDMTDRARYEDGLLAVGQKFRHLNAEIRHDILNQLTILIGFLQFSEDLATDDKFRDFIGKEIVAGEKIQRLIEFTREYQDIAEQGPCWFDCATLLGKVVNEVGEDKAVFTPLRDKWEIFAHPMIESAIERLLHYVLLERRPSVPAKIIVEETSEGLNITVEDYAVPVPPAEKNLIFERGHGKAGIELWLVRELLSLSGISIIEDGDTGGRFVMTVPGSLVRKKG